MTNFFRRTTLAFVLTAGAALALQPTPTEPEPKPEPKAPAAPADAPKAPQDQKPAPIDRSKVESLPNGREVLAKYVEVTGGKAAYEKLTNRVAEGTTEVMSRGLSGTLTIKQQAPDKMVASIDYGYDLGPIVVGYNGVHGWQSNSITGASLMEGEELEASKLQSQFAAEINPDLICKRIDTIGTSTVGAIECIVVELETKGGAIRTAYYGREDGLLHRMDVPATMSLASATARTFLSDYRDAGGIKFPFKHVMQLTVAGIKVEQTMNFTKVTHNTEMPADTFSPPKDVQALIDKAAKKKAAADKAKETPASPAATPTEKPAAK